jgi:hypothetical protein
MLIIKPKLPKTQTIYFDVDDTLIFEALPHEDGAFILNDGESWQWYKSHNLHTAEVKKSYKEGNQVIIWTHHQLGADWAYQVGIALGFGELEGGLENLCVAKPDIFFDDMSAEEVLHPSLRKYLAKNS